MKETVSVSEFMQDLAARQDNAARLLAESATAGVGFNKRVRLTHGAVCAPAFSAVKQVESARENAANALAAFSAGLAAKIRDSDTVFKTTDSAAGDDLNKQML
jgi:hypothetical protein